MVKGSGSFDINYVPGGPKARLRHYFCESPNPGGTLYKYQLELEKGVNAFDLPHWFDWLNEEAYVYVSPFRHYGAAWGEVVGNVCEIHCRTAGKFNVLIMGQRKDPVAMEDFNKYGVEYIAPDTPPPSPPSSPRNDE